MHFNCEGGGGARARNVPSCQTLAARCGSLVGVLWGSLSDNCIDSPIFYIPDFVDARHRESPY